ncbi:J domain-containing protein [Anoxybacterium hadale]|uniref:J domain-containing protein n=1 Tax=Anoxybacterium hadale TaxID=3408580 RepID=A0ACD1A912_9FIRM|nr:J domain-containing protein [Clostridiales bacterium]
MQNPYEVLGIKEGASQEEIKAAYREQVKKYHPDKYQNNPLQDLAEEKLQEINEAYETLTKNNGNGNYQNYTSGMKNNGNQGQSSEFAEIRRMIDRGNLPGAEATLGRVRTRNAEWFFLNGMIALRKGWYDEAVNQVQTAMSMDPSNMEYRNAMNSIMASGAGYRTNSYGRGYNSNDELCRMLQCYCCADALCDCI